MGNCCSTPADTTGHEDRDIPTLPQLHGVGPRGYHGDDDAPATDTTTPTDPSIPSAEVTEHRPHLAEICRDSMADFYTKGPGAVMNTPFNCSDAFSSSTEADSDTQLVRASKRKKQGPGITPFNAEDAFSSDPSKSSGSGEDKATTNYRDSLTARDARGSSRVHPTLLAVMAQSGEPQATTPFANAAEAFARLERNSSGSLPVSLNSRDAFEASVVAGMDAAARPHAALMASINLSFSLDSYSTATTSTNVSASGGKMPSNRTHKVLRCSSETTIEPCLDGSQSPQHSTDANPLTAQNPHAY